MTKSHTLYLTDHYLVYSEVDTNDAHVVFTMAFNEIGFEEKFRDFLEKSPAGIISIFVDVMGEEIRHEHIPHIGGQDRERLLKRKFKSLFPTADLTWKQHLEREKDGRKDDIYLLLGITLPAPAKHAMEVLVECGKEVRGVYFLPVLQQQLRDLLPDISQYLIISSIPGNKKNKKNYRQTFYKDKTLSVSRLTTASGSSEQEMFDQLFREIERTYQFLDGTRQLDQSKPLSIIVMLSEHDSACLIDRSSNVNINFSYASLAELAQKLGMNSDKIYDNLPELLCQQAIRKNLKPHSRPTDICSQHKVNALKKHLNLSSVAAIVISLMIAGGLWLSAHQQSERYTVLASEVAKKEQKKISLSEQLPVTEVPPKIMHQAVQLYRDIASNDYKPDQVLEVIAGAYNGYQDIALKQIIWVNKGQQESNTNDLDGGSSQSSDVPFIQTLNTPPQFKIVIQPDPSMSNRVMLARVDSFSASLLQQAEITQVTREKSAIDTRSTAQLEESFGRQRDDKLADFTLLITM